MNDSNVNGIQTKVNQTWNKNNVKWNITYPSLSMCCYHFPRSYCTSKLWTLYKIIILSGAEKRPIYLSFTEHYYSSERIEASPNMEILCENYLYVA